MLHRLEFADRALEGDPFLGVFDGDIEDRLQGACHLGRAHRRAHLHQRIFFQTIDRFRDFLRYDPVEADPATRFTGETAALANSASSAVDKRHDMPAAVAGQDCDPLRLVREGDIARRARKFPVFAQRQALAGTRGRDGHRSHRHDQASLGKQPTGQQGFGQRHRHGEFAGNLQHVEAVDDRRARPA